MVCFYVFVVWWGPLYVAEPAAGVFYTPSAVYIPCSQTGQGSHYSGVMTERVCEGDSCSDFTSETACVAVDCVTCYAI